MTKARVIVLAVEDKPGTVAQAIAALAEANVNLLSVLGWSPQGILQLVVDDASTAAVALQRRGIAWSEEDAEIAEMPNEPGSLHAYLATLADKGVNLRSLIGFSCPDSDKSYVVWTAIR